jgi:AmiR/NasT family two-component response regulator
VRRRLKSLGRRWKISGLCGIKSAMDAAGRDPDRDRTATAPIRLRVLVADEQAEPLERMAAVARRLGHDVVAVELTVSATARAIREQSPELAIVGLHEDEEHALELIEEIVDEGVCPVIVQTDGEDPGFAARAAERGAFGFSSPVEPEALQSAIEMALRRFGELEELTQQIENLEGAMRRRAIVERAKGITMERDGIDEREAFELLRTRARSSNRTLVDVAQALLDGQS